jgi:hypothetical protein
MVFAEMDEEAMVGWRKITRSSSGRGCVKLTDGSP